MSSATRPSASSCGLQVGREVLRRRAHHVLLVEPQQLVEVERRGRLVHVVDVEQPRHLLAREDLLVAMRPAEAHEVVEQRLGQVALVAVLQHAHRAVALGELRAVGAEDHRHVRVERRLDAERAQHVDLPRRVVEVVVAADHVRDPHVLVVDHHAEVVGGLAVRARDDQVVEFAVLERDRPCTTSSTTTSPSSGLRKRITGLTPGSGSLRWRQRPS